MAHYCAYPQPQHVPQAKVGPGFCLAWFLIPDACTITCVVIGRKVHNADDQR